jgi:hypothetical protein
MLIINPFHPHTRNTPQNRMHVTPDVHHTGCASHQSHVIPNHKTTAKFKIHHFGQPGLWGHISLYVAKQHHCDIFWGPHGAPKVPPVRGTKFSTFFAEYTLFRNTIL